MASGKAPPSLAYIWRSFMNSSAMISESGLASPWGSTARSFQIAMRLELVSEPSSSAKQVLGRRKTSVWMLSVLTSLSGP